ncbi:MAG: autotransporter-associated beta strand repeat-containing protein [Thermoguttaceae bacterium]
MASATEQYFNVPSGEYESASSWYNGVVPTNGDNAYIGWAYGDASAATLSSAVPNVAFLYLGSAEYASGQLDLLNGASLSGGSARLGNAYGATGTLTVADGASFTAASGYFCIGRIAGGTGIVTQTGGNVTAPGWNGGSGEKGYVYIGSGGTGTYHLTGGTFACDYQFYVGNSAGSSGTIVQDGGLLAVTGDFAYFGVGCAGTGTYEMNGGSFITSQSFTVASQDGGVGTLNQTGGVMSGGTLTNIGNSGIGAYNMSGGVFTCPTMRLATSGSGTVHQTGGTVNVTGEMQFAFVAAGTGVYNLDGGTLNAGSINLGMAGAGTLNVSGGVINGNGLMAGSGVANISKPRYGSGAVYQTGGEVNLQGDLVIRGYTNSTGSYTFDNGALNVGGNVSGLGTLYFNGGTLHCGGTISTNASLGANPVFHEGNSDVCVVTGALSDASGVAGTLTKSGGGWLVLQGANTYTGKTTVQAGVLQMNAAAYATVLSHTADVQGGQLLFNYTDTTTPVLAIRSSLHSGAMYTSTGAAQGCGVGYSDDGVGLVTAKVALLGDTDMGGIVNNDDLARLLSALGGTDCLWVQGDFNYDSKVNNDDLAMLLSNLGKTFAGFGSVKAQALGGAVPEPSTLVLLTAGLLGLAAYAWRKRK